MLLIISLYFSKVSFFFFFLRNRSISACSAISLLLLSVRMCDTELKSLSLSTLLQGAERYFCAIWARVGNLMKGFSERRTLVSPRYASSCMVVAAGGLLSDAHLSAISSKTLSRLLPGLSLWDLLSAGASCVSGVAVSYPQTFFAAPVSTFLWPYWQHLCWRRIDLYTLNKKQWWH